MRQATEARGMRIGFIYFYNPAAGLDSLAPACSPRGGHLVHAPKQLPSRLLLGSSFTFLLFALAILQALHVANVPTVHPVSMQHQNDRADRPEGEWRGHHIVPALEQEAVVQYPRQEEEHPKCEVVAPPRVHSPEREWNRRNLQRKSCHDADTKVVLQRHIEQRHVKNVVPPTREESELVRIVHDAVVRVDHQVREEEGHERAAHLVVLEHFGLCASRRGQSGGDERGWRRWWRSDGDTGGRSLR
mmetsp:Transcript_73741/g.210230  ORF Transcript_73741/g.210230 Transcript_73741/m.210230 type:complete len:245 (-) Transcript_73741:393-1127(-)